MQMSRERGEREEKMKEREGRMEINRTSSRVCGLRMMWSIRTWNNDSKMATNMEEATRVNSPIDVTFFAEIPTIESNEFVFCNTTDGSSSTWLRDRKKLFPVANGMIWSFWWMNTNEPNSNFGTLTAARCGTKQSLFICRGCQWMWDKSIFISLSV